MAALLQGLDINAVWESAEDQERRVLVEELLEWANRVSGSLGSHRDRASPLNALYGEVGLTESDLVGVGGVAPFCLGRQPLL